MATRISNADAAAVVDTLVGALNAGAAAGYIEIRSGAQPASVGTAASGTLLATLTLSDPAFGAATAANPSVATAGAITGDTAADATGTAGWFRAFDSNAVAHIDGSVRDDGDPDNGEDMVIDNKNIVAGGAVNLSSWTVSHGTGA